MTKSGRLAAALLLANCALATAALAETSRGAACRASAAYKEEGGVEYGKLDAISAIDTCEKALAEMPKDLAILAYYSRALQKAGRLKDALQAARSSAEGGHPMGQRVLANIFE